MKHLAVAALCVAVGVPALFVVWSKAAQLLNARSDFSVLLGCAMLFVVLVFIVALVYFVLTRFIFKRETNGERAQQQQAELNDSVEPRSLFSETINSVEHLNETDKSEFKRE